MNKFLIYTSNLSTMPKDMEDIIKFAQETPKFYICNVELNPYLSDVKAGDNIITTRGNSIYVIRALENGLQDFTGEEKDYIDQITRNYGLKKSNITGVSKVIKFETWCYSAKPFVKFNSSIKMEKKASSVKGMLGRIENMFKPQRAENVRIVMSTGDIAVETNQGYVAIDKNNVLNAYPEEFTLDFPVYIISKPKDQVAVGDVIATDRGYAKVTKIEGNKINAIGYTGSCRKIRTINDVLFNQSMVRVVVSLAGNVGGNINPLVFAALRKEGGDKFESLLPILMMSQQNGAVGVNPMMMALLAGEDSSLKDVMLMSMMSGNNNPLGNLFAQPVAQAPVEEAAAEDEAED